MCASDNSNNRNNRKPITADELAEAAKHAITHDELAEIYAADDADCPMPTSYEQLDFSTDGEDLRIFPPEDTRTDAERFEYRSTLYTDAGAMIDQAIIEDALRAHLSHIRDAMEAADKSDFLWNRMVERVHAMLHMSHRALACKAYDALRND